MILDDDYGEASDGFHINFDSNILNYDQSCQWHSEFFLWEN
jgi:hypothetical protein